MVQLFFKWSGVKNNRLWAPTNYKRAEDFLDISSSHAGFMFTSQSNLVQYILDLNNNSFNVCFQRPSFVIEPGIYSSVH